MDEYAWVDKVRAVNARSTDPDHTECSGLCIRGSDVGVYGGAGDPVAYAHPMCPKHGEQPHDFVHSLRYDGAGRELCKQCRAYADEH